MTYSLIKIGLALLVIWTAVSVGAKAIGSLRPPNPALRGFIKGCENQPQPCWYAIVPGKAITEETLTLVGQYRVEFPNNPGAPLIFGKSETACNVDITLKDDSQEVDFFFVEGHCNLQLGDVLATLGRPKYINPADLHSTQPPMLIYPNGTRIWLDSCCHLSLYSRVKQMFLTSFAVIPSTMPKWYGFVPKWRYCQLERVLIACTP